MGEQYITEQQNLEKAFYSSYRILTNKISFEELLYEDHNNGSPTLLVHDPEKNITVGVIQDLIDYFVDLEEYELCAELKAEMDKKFSA